MGANWPLKFLYTVWKVNWKALITWTFPDGRRQPQSEGRLLPGYLSWGPELAEFEYSAYIQYLCHHFCNNFSNLVGIFFGLFKLIRLDVGVCSVEKSCETFNFTMHTSTSTSTKSALPDASQLPCNETVSKQRIDAEGSSVQVNCRDVVLRDKCLVPLAEDG